MDLRRALGTFVSKHENYLLRIVVADLIRELLTDRFDRHLFWPRGTPGVAFNDFPLARVGDSEWLCNTVEFMSAISTSQAFHVE